MLRPNAIPILAASITSVLAQLPAGRSHLQAAGKRKKVALVACMRKLLVTLNAILRTQKPSRSPAMPA